LKGARTLEEKPGKGKSNSEKKKKKSPVGVQNWKRRRGGVKTAWHSRKPRGRGNREKRRWGL